MKTKKLLFGALLSLFAFSASAEDVNVVVEHFTQTWFGTETVNYIDPGFTGTDTVFTVGDTIYIKGTLDGTATPTSVQLQVFDCVNWNSCPTIINATVNGNEVTGEYPLGDDVMLSDFPSGKNTKLALRIYIVYPADIAHPGKNIVEFDGWNGIRIEPVGGIYPEVFDPLLTATMTHIAADGTETEYVQGEWVLFNGGPALAANANPTVRAGDVLRFQGTYLTDVDGVKAVALGGHFSYTAEEDTSWAPTKFGHVFTLADESKGNLDGTFDFKIVVPSFIPEDILIGGTGFDNANSYYEHIQIRATYADPTYEYAGKTLADGGYANWQGLTAIWEGEKPVLGASVSGINVISTTENSVTLDWDLAKDAAWQVAFIAEGSEVRNPQNCDTFYTVNTMPAIVGGLEPGTDYKAYVRAVKDPNADPIEVGAFNAFANGIPFTTKPLSVSDSEVANVTLYPNPTNGLLTIAADAEYEIEVSDLAGRLVMSTSIAAEAKQLDFSEMNSGIYLVRFINGEKSFTKSFIKQ